MAAAQSTIVQLAQLISTSISVLEQICNSNGTPVPDLNAFGFERASEAFRRNFEAAEAAKVAAAACMHLCAILRPPTDTLYNLALGEHHSFAVRVCLEANVTEILREAGPGGLHINDISAQCGIDPSKLGRIIRYPVIHHVYRELKPNVFTNNRVSSTMDTGKPSKNILYQTLTINMTPLKQASQPLSATSKVIVFLTRLSQRARSSLDIDHKCTTVVWDVLKDPVLGHSKDITNTVFSHGLKTDLTYWKFLQQPDNAARHRRFGFAMQGMKAIEPADMILSAFDWETLRKASTVIDVGGGIGVTIMPLAKKYPNLNIVIQDLAPVVEEAAKYWSLAHPEALATGKVKIEVQDFLTPQKLTNPSVFIVKYILHNWPRPYMAEILHRLREVATPDTVLIIIDNVLPYACCDSASKSLSNGSYPERTEFRIAPEPLLPNYGAIGHNAYTLDLTMMLYFNAQEHTVTALKDLLEGTRWKLQKFRSVDPKNPFLQSVEAVPQ